VAQKKAREQLEKQAKHQERDFMTMNLMQRATKDA
jgi:hypothetical protein